MAGKNTAVFGIYPNRTSVESAVDALKTAEFRNSDISVLFPENTGTKDFAHEKNTKAPEGATTGAGTGALLVGGRDRGSLPRIFKGLAGPPRGPWPSDRNSFRGGNMPNDNLKKLYVDELKDLFSAENQLLKALPKMAKAASSDELRAGFEEHLEQTKGHVQRLENILQSLDESPKGKKCVGMEGLVKEGAEVMAEDLEEAVMDAGLIGAARRVEHYEIAAYGAVSELAKALGETNHASLLKQTLEEEQATNEKLTELAKEINEQASEESSQDNRDESKKTHKMPRRVA